jgi:hypothetical protein
MFQEEKTAAPHEPEATETKPIAKSTSQEETNHTKTSSNDVERVIVCYKDGTSSTYLNKN